MGNGRGKVVPVTIKKPTNTNTNTTTTTKPPVAPQPQPMPTKPKKGSGGGDGIGGAGGAGGEGAPAPGGIEPKGKEPEAKGVEPHDPKKMYSGMTNDGEIEYNIQNNFLAPLQGISRASRYRSIGNHNYSDNEKEQIATFLRFAHKYNPKHSSGEEVISHLKKNGVEFFGRNYRPATDKEKADLEKIYASIRPPRQRSPYMSDEEWVRAQRGYDRVKNQTIGDEASLGNFKSFLREMTPYVNRGHFKGTDLEDTAKSYMKIANSATAMLAKKPEMIERLSPNDKRDYSRTDFSVNPHSKKAQNNKAKFENEMSKNPYFARNMALMSDVLIDLNSKIASKNIKIDGLSIDFTKNAGANGYTLASTVYSGIVLNYDNLQLGAKDSFYPDINSRGGSNKTRGYMDGWSSSYHGSLGTMLHEAGHQVHFQLSFGNWEDSEKITKFYGKSHYTETFSNKGKAKNGGPSGYGSGSGTVENFSESFAMYVTGAFPRTDHVEYKRFKQLMNDVGLGHLEGAYSGEKLAKFHRGDSSSTSTSKSSTSTSTPKQPSSKLTTTSAPKTPPSYNKSYTLPGGATVNINPTGKDKARGYTIVKHPTTGRSFRIDLNTGKISRHLPGVAGSARAQKNKKITVLVGDKKH